MDPQQGVQLQELLLILEDHWRRNKDVQGVPIYQASGLATKALSVYQAYIEMMNEDIRTAFDQVAHALRCLTEQCKTCSTLCQSCSPRSGISVCLTRPHPR